MYNNFFSFIFCFIFSFSVTKDRVADIIQVVGIKLVAFRFFFPLFLSLTEKNSVLFSWLCRFEFSFYDINQGIFKMNN